MLIKDSNLKPLTQDQRRTIENLFFRGFKKSEIARRVDRHRSTVCREVNDKENWDFVRYRNKVKKSYSAVKAKQNYDLAKANCGAKLKFTKYEKSLELVEQQFFEKKYSPDQIIGSLGAPFTSRTFYNYVQKDISKVKPHDLLRKVGRKRVKSKKRREHKRLVGKSIVERPEFINNRSEFGHGEGDTIVDDLDNAVMVVVERKSRKVVLQRMDKMDSENGNIKVANAIEQLKLKSVTVDNGREFYKLSKLEKEIYYTHPYSSWEKGSVENINSIIRRFIPKGKILSEVSDETLARIQDYINNMPRKILNYKTANEVFDTLSAA